MTQQAKQLRKNAAETPCQPAQNTGQQAGPREATQVLLDGRILEADFKRLATQSKDEQASSSNCQPYHKPQPVRAKSLRSTLADDKDKAPLTPPRVAGISLAPQLDSEHFAPLADAVKEACKDGQRITKDHHSNIRSARPLAPKGCLASLAQANAASKAAAPTRNPSDPGSTNNSSKADAVAKRSCNMAGHTDSQALQLDLIAQGRSLANRPGVTTQQGAGSNTDDDGHRQLLTAVKTVDQRLAMYLEINETDSLCSTPPIISIEALRASNDEAFGPLSLVPMSPSLITVCQDINGLRIDASGAHSDGSSVFWQSYDKLPDMRACDSPVLP